AERRRRTMRPLRMGIVPGPVMTRVLLLDGPHTLLQARLPHGSRLPRTVQTLAEALALWTCPERADTSQLGVSPRGGSPYGEAGGGERGTPAEATVVHAGVQGRGHRLGAPGRSVVAGDLPRARPE